MKTKHLGLGIGWRGELALPIDRYPQLGFVELLAEDFDPDGALPEPVGRLHERGVTVIPHGVSLSLGSAEQPSQEGLQRLNRLADRLGSPLVSEHIAFVRAAGLESGHLLPLPQTEEALAILVENILAARKGLTAPLALENVASLFQWPHAEMDEATFLAEAVTRADVGFLLDIENVYANCRNHNWDALDYLEKLPLNRIAYVHIAGGVERNGLYHDTHAHPVPRAVLDLLEELCARTPVPGVMLERDDRFPTSADLTMELDAIATAVVRGNRRRERSRVHV